MTQKPQIYACYAPGKGFRWVHDYGTHAHAAPQGESWATYEEAVAAGQQALKALENQSKQKPS